MLIRISPEADAELTEAREWYSHHRDKLDLEFMECIDEALRRVASQPRASPLVYRSLRRVVVRRFPFAILYELSAGEIQVIAIFHSRRDPKIWKSRVE
jgi:plasmid stabilization system protein ParE